MNRWVLFFSACLLQALGLFLMCLGQHFSQERPKKNRAFTYARRSGRLLFAAGALALGAFALLDSDLLLFTGQGILVLLCLAGTPVKRHTTPHKGKS